MGTPRNALFSWVDYTIFGLMLGASTIIGIYFGFFGKNTADDYLRGGKKMKVIPVALSVIASQISTGTLLAVPADVYRFGANYLWLGLSMLMQTLLGYYVILPVFFGLEITSIFEYLHLRFDKKVQIMASFLNLVGLFICCPIVIYVPSLAFAQVTGTEVIVVASISSAFCMFYTAIGGFKAVVWTDVFQFFIMVASYLILFGLGVYGANGFGLLWSKCVEGHRLDVLDFSFDPTLRDSFGALIIGGTIHWLAITSVGAVSVQKFLSVSTLADLKRVTVIYGVGASLMHVLAAFVGLLIYANYWDCDPISSKQVSSIDQLVPYFVMDVAGNLKGYPGVFIAGVFSAGMSTVSACLNTMSAIIYKDFVSAFIPASASQRFISYLLKIIVLIIGVVCTILVLTLEKINGIFPVYTGIYAASIGPTLGLYVLGLLIPVANSKGALLGTLSGIAFVAFVFIQSVRLENERHFTKFLKPISTDGCGGSFSGNTTTEVNADLPFFLYRISFWYNACMGAAVTVFVGVVVSFFTKHDRAPVPKVLLSPILQIFRKEKSMGTEAELTLLEAKK